MYFFIIYTLSYIDILGLPINGKFFIAILSVIGDNFSKARNTIAEVIFVLLCVYVSRYTLIFCNVPCIVLRLHFS